MNVFSIDTFEINFQNDGTTIIMKYTAVIKARVDIKCNEHGRLLFTIKMETQGSGLNDAEAFQKSIQSLLDHEYYPTSEMHSVRCNCSPVLDKIHYDFSNLEEPFKKLFEDLFKESNWTIPKLITA